MGARGVRRGALSQQAADRRGSCGISLHIVKVIRFPPSRNLWFAGERVRTRRILGRKTIRGALHLLTATAELGARETVTAGRFDRGRAGGAIPEGAGANAAERRLDVVQLAFEDGRETLRQKRLATIVAAFQLIQRCALVLG